MHCIHVFRSRRKCSSNSCIHHRRNSSSNHHRSNSSNGSNRCIHHHYRANAVLNIKGKLDEYRHLIRKKSAKKWVDGNVREIARLSYMS